MPRKKSTKIPPYRKAWDGTDIGVRRLNWVNNTRKALLAKRTPEERYFAKWMAGLVLRKSSVLWFQQQKVFNVASEVVFFADFYYKTFRLIVEIDGKQHRVRRAKAWDEWRTSLLEERGLRVIRFSNELLIDDIQAVSGAVIQGLLDCPERARAKRTLLKELQNVQRKRPRLAQVLLPWVKD